MNPTPTMNPTAPAAPATPNIRGFISAAQAQGQSSDQIFNYLSSKGYVSNGKITDTPTPAAPAPEPSYASKVATNLGNTFNQGGQNVMSDINNMNSTVETGTTGQKIGGAVLDVAKTAGHLAGDVAGTAGGIIGSFITPLLPDSVKSGIGDVAKYVSDKVNSIPGMTPDIAKGLGDVFNTLTLKGGEMGEPAIKGAVTNVASKGLETAGAGAEKVINAGSAIGEKIGLAPKSIEATGASASASALKDATDIVSPKMTAKDTADALAQGRGQGGGLFSKTKIAPDPMTIKTAEAVQGIVKKGVPASKNIANLRQSLTTEAENLKSQIQSVDHPYSFKELNAKLNGVETPISIKGTAFEKQIGAVKQAAMTIAKKEGGTVSSLLDARKGFDALVSKEYPNLYDSASAPMKNAITSIRNAMNDFIEQNLPDNMSFKDSLTKQSMYYRAIDNIAEKAVGDTKKTGIGKMLEKHPILKEGLKYGTAGLIGGGIVHEL